ncbi:hypothetical protein GQ457_04G016090 [Hibiscus cannabinus]
MVMIALVHGLDLFAAMTFSINISGIHVNPAVTFSVLLGGRISLVCAVYCWIAKLLGDTVACLLLRLTNALLLVSTADGVHGGVWTWRVALRDTKDSADIWIDVHNVWNDGGSEKREHGDNNTPNYRVNSGHKHLSRRAV